MRVQGSALAFLALLASVAAHAESREATLFDRPVSVRTVPPKSDNDPTGELRCTWYRDFMVRETGTDSPAPGQAAIIPAPDAARRPACSAARAVGEVALTTEDHSLLGRKGPFLVFDATDPNGAVPFSVLDAGTGRVIYTDGKTTDGMRSVALEGGALHLRYTRAFNASCSILKDGAGCWSKIAQEGTLPAGLAQSPPPVQACAAAYRKDHVPADDPSMITYDVDVTLDTAGKVQVKPLGTVGCEPMP